MIIKPYVGIRIIPSFYCNRGCEFCYQKEKRDGKQFTEEDYHEFMNNVHAKIKYFGMLNFHYIMVHGGELSCIPRKLVISMLRDLYHAYPHTKLCVLTADGDYLQNLIKDLGKMFPIEYHTTLEGYAECKNCINGQLPQVINTYCNSIEDAQDMVLRCLGYVPKGIKVNLCFDVRSNFVKYMSDYNIHTLKSELTTETILRGLAKRYQGSDINYTYGMIAIAGIQFFIKNITSEQYKELIILPDGSTSDTRESLMD